MTDQQPGPLDGIRVLDLSRFIAGPLCGQLLGDMGAEVIKVERPRGEDAREQGVRFKGESLYTMAFNRNKFGVTLDTRHPRAAEILARLIRVSDVLIENYRPGTLETMGLGQARLRRAQSAARGDLAVGIRPDGPVVGQGAVRPDRPGHVRADGADRRP